MIDYFNIDTTLWHEPLENPQRTKYNSLGYKKEFNGAFGFVRNGGAKSHAGLDIFADINTPCYACLDGKVEGYIAEVKDKNDKGIGYGNVLILKVKGEDLRNSRNDTVLEFPDDGEIEQAKDFNINADYFYLRYCHLSTKRTDLNVGDMVKSGDLIGYTGDTGNAEHVVNPHLHFEIAMNPISNRSTAYDPQTNKLGYKINPAFFVNLQPIDEDEQTKVKERRKEEEEARKKREEQAKKEKEAKAKQQRTKQK
nr:M23 family metallopeptidase [Gilliamella sp. Pas-s27]